MADRTRSLQGPRIDRQQNDAVGTSGGKSWRNRGRSGHRRRLSINSFDDIGRR